ncbi:MAG: DUF2784 domain-containing protein [Polaromonas sp.]|uniref:DUF2784 domain-containing protein n=1 Tax=Polaromonas sp. TaxID=1869339 RepID=UPI004035ECB2
MMTGWLADAVLLAHLLFIVFAVGGGLLALRWSWMPWLHLPALAWGATVEFTGWICPLTPLENALRQAGGAAGYTESFVEYYLLPLIYPGALTRELQWALGGALLLINAVVYGLVWHRRRRPQPA